MAGVISKHPHEDKRPKNFDLKKPCRYFIRSALFSKMFSKVTDIKVFQLIASYCGSQSGGPLGNAEVVLVDDNGDEHVFEFETFFNRYEALTLAVYKAPKLTIVAS